MGDALDNGVEIPELVADVGDPLPVTGYGVVMFERGNGAEDERPPGNGTFEAPGLLVDGRPLKGPVPRGALLLEKALVAPGSVMVEFGKGYGPDELPGVIELRGTAEAPVPGAVEPLVGPAAEVVAPLITDGPVPRGAVLAPDPDTRVVLFGKGTELDTGDVEPEETAPGDRVLVPVDGTVLFVSGKGTDGKPGVEVGSAEPIGPPVPADPGNIEEPEPKPAPVELGIISDELDIGIGTERDDSWEVTDPVVLDPVGPVRGADKFVTGKGADDDPDGKMLPDTGGVKPVLGALVRLEPVLGSVVPSVDTPVGRLEEFEVGEYELNDVVTEAPVPEGGGNVPDSGELELEFAVRNGGELEPDGKVLLAEIGKGADIPDKLDEEFGRPEPPDAEEDIAAGVGV
ncbi:hypothetical protein NCU01987 [Neurospora crassa OR74A]|uniref:Uncharacterized protein n=1 Tax=Neurospora crassa (strain ATCC 24698 / 74-OR23-1A / CBS 708.71 / DSM 1257 / FGSC 987) TaxID=367110 RepID=Q7SFP4_NEUCR|nr:hypothetical protein NCU01987 [Neurospora crassa OR74A]EAA35616.3 hypothetical protein NCU01987 [Neurospora crassa OR74A]|eukprot:XP_964852.3 hypothetical protein NCU01987 [Neurospora crassa OR74A]